MADDKSGVDGLRSKLYSRKGGVEERDRATLSQTDPNTPVAWEPKGAPERPVPQAALRDGVRRKFFGLSHASRFFVGSVVFFVAAAGFSAYYFFGGGNFISSQNIEIEIITPSIIDGGSETQVQYIVTNRNASPLLLADLVIDYPSGTRDPKNPTKEMLHERQTIGAISPGQQVKRTSNAIFYGTEGTPQAIEVRLEYSVPNSNAVFEKTTTATIVLGSSPVSVSVEMPAEATSGQPFDIEVTLRSNAEEPIDGVVFEARYPFGYSLRTATPKAATGALWRVGTLEPGGIYTLTLRGVLDGSDGDEKVFHFMAGTNSDPTDTRVTVPFITMPQSITVERPFIGGAITVNGQSGATVSARAGEPVQGTVSWRNNLSEAVQDVEVVLTFAGAPLDTSSITSATGFYQSSNSTLTWTKQQDPSLAQVAPGGGGSLQFSFSTLPPGSGGTVYANPTVSLTLGVRGSRTDQAGVPEAVLAAATTQVSLSSAVSLEATANHASGPNPPRANETSEYSVVWSVRNSSNAVANATVTTVLPPYVEFVDGAGIVYDPGSRTVRWSIGELKAGTGYSSSALQTSFQVALNASASQEGDEPALTGSSVLQGTDRFAQVQVSSTAPAVDTGAEVE